jgi:hypothetical protein
LTLKNGAIWLAYPVAQENDGERAVRVALAIQRALAELNRKNDGTCKPVLAARNPGSPTIITSCPSPCRARSQRRISIAISSSRPTSGVRWPTGLSSVSYR